MSQPSPFRPAYNIRLDTSDLGGLLDDLDGRLTYVSTAGGQQSDLTLTCRSCVACTNTCVNCTNRCTNGCLDDLGQVLHW
jgi:hypothetical protein